MTTDDNGATEVIRELEREPQRRRRDGVGWIVVAFMLGALCMGLLVVSGKLDSANEKILTNATKIEQQNVLLKEQRNQFLECTGKQGENNPNCIRPVVPSVTITPVKPNDPSKQKTLSVEEVEAIAATVIAKQKFAPTPAQYQAIARISATLIPKQPTTAQITNIIKATVAAYCVNDRCRGKDAPTITPQPGKDGSPGADSTVPGPAGADATDAQVMSAVTAFCQANNDCKGPKGDTGDKGDKGDKGDPGRGLASLECNADGVLVAHYTDDTQQVIADSQCKLIPNVPGQN